MDYAQAQAEYEKWLASGRPPLPTTSPIKDYAQAQADYERQQAEKNRPPPGTVTATPPPLTPDQQFYVDEAKRLGGTEAAKSMQAEIERTRTPEFRYNRAVGQSKEFAIRYQIFREATKKQTAAARKSIAEWERDVLPGLSDYLKREYAKAKKQGNYDKFNQAMDRIYKQTAAYAGVVSGIVSEEANKKIHNWELTVLPKLPAPLQAEYKEAKESGDYTKFNKVFTDFTVNLATQAGAVGTQQKLYEIREKERIEALKILEPYAFNNNTQYRIADFILAASHHDSTQTAYAEGVLEKAGWDKDQIEEAKGVIDWKAAQVNLSPISSGAFDFITKPMGMASLKMEDWLTEFMSHTGESQAKTPTQRAIDTAMEGIGAAGATVVLAIPILLTRMGGNPSKAPQVAWEAGKGMATLVGNTLYKGMSGQYMKDLNAGNWSNFIYDTTMSYMIVTGLGKPVKNAVFKITTYVAPRLTTFGTLGKEISTGRIRVSADTLSKNYADAANKVERLAYTKGGKYTGQVPIEGTPYELRYLKTPVQQVVGDVLFSGTKDEIVNGVISKESLLRIAERDGRIKAGNAGLYNSPWAAIGYTRGGVNPGILMTITDAVKFRSGAAGLKRGLTQSDKYIKGADEGFYGSSKSWRGDLETEIVEAPGTKTSVPQATDSLSTRLTVGKGADLAVWDGDHFVPIKIGVDTRYFNPETIRILKQPSTWYAIKLFSIYNALRDTSQAVRNPKLLMKDLNGTLKELLNLKKSLVREGGTGTRGAGQFPGVRDVYVIRNWGKSITEIARNIRDEAAKRAREKLGKGIADNSKVFRDEIERASEDVYRQNADALINSFGTLAKSYVASRALKSKFENSYLSNFRFASLATTKSLSASASSVDTAISDMVSRAPRNVSEATSRAYTERHESIKSRESSISSAVESPSIPVSERPPESPVIERPPQSPPPDRRPPPPRTPERRPPPPPVTPPPRTPPPPGERPRTPPPPPPPPPPDTRDSEKRELLSTKQGMVARRRGELRGYSIWRVNYYPYGPTDKLVLFGNPPEGAIPASGPGSVANSATLIFGKPPDKPILDDTGAVDDIIYPIMKKDGKGIVVRSVKDTQVISKPKPVEMIRGPYKKRGRPSKASLPSKDLGGGIEQTAKGRHIRL